MRRTAAVATMAGLALGLGGCASLFSDDALTTGSISPVPQVRPVAYSAADMPRGVAPDDWALAREALGEALAAHGTAPSVPWENPGANRRGTVTLVGPAQPRDAGSCRGFLISFVPADQPGTEDAGKWVEGEACRGSRAAAWKIDQARLLQRT
ncbi:RT0821/Lpp0805 family surface protein [Ancylobacter lacus]|uniref:RT0821/Lpp0805 family surface protein n=1 Tax=Ancylobacter lacus TaxID=2579970 RepID=UPI0031B884FA